MKRIIRYISIPVILLTIGLIYGACTDMERDFQAELVEYPEITVEDFSPKEGRPGTAVTITGTNFGEHPEAAEVSFNGVLVTEFESYNDTELIAVLPEDAGTGPISVQVWTHQKSFEEEFTYIPGAKVSSYSSEKGQAGDVITINGSNFGDDPEIVKVYIGEVEAEIVAITTDRLEFRVPDTNSGELSIQVGPQEIVGPFFLIGGEKLTGIMIGHSGSWGGNPATEIHAALDGDVETFVDGPTSTGFVGYDLGEEKVAQLTSVRYFPRVSHPQRMVDGEIRGSNDPSLTEYQVLHTISEQPGTDNYAEIQIDNEQTFRYVYYYSPDGNCNLSEVEFYGNVEIVEVPEGKYVFEFNSPEEDTWRPGQDAGFEIEDGKLKVTFNESQFEGTNKRRADLYYIIGGNYPHPNGSPKDHWVYSSDYPILAFRIENLPAQGNIFPDIRGAGSFGNNNHEKDFVDQDVIYYDLSDRLEDGASLDLMQLKIADITSDETGYEVDWVRTFQSKAELQTFLDQ